MGPKLGSQHSKTTMKILFPHQWDTILRSSHMKDALTQIKMEKNLSHRFRNSGRTHPKIENPMK
jgi:hypothetical protein